MSNVPLEPHKVSVVIPCFNHGLFLGESLKSLEAQTLQPAEVIVVNDGSTDPETLRILAGLDESRVSLITTANRGPAAARNTAIKAACGDYILPLDADDRISPGFLEKTVPALVNNPKVGIVYPQTEFFGSQTGRFQVPAYRFPEILIANTIVNTSLFRKADWTAVGGYDERMDIGWEDYDLWLSIIALGRDVVHVPEAFLYYRKHRGSRTEKMFSIDAAITCYARIFRNHPQLYADHIEVVFRALIQTRYGHSGLSKQRSAWSRFVQRIGF